MDFAEMLKDAASASIWSPSGTPEEMLDTLEKGIEEFNAECFFEVGDIVTPKKDSNERGRGKPFKVVEVLDKPELACEPKRGEPLTMYDMVVACHLKGGIDLFRNNSADYEKWEPEKLRR